MVLCEDSNIFSYYQLGLHTYVGTTEHIILGLIILCHYLVGSNKYILCIMQHRKIEQLSTSYLIKGSRSLNHPLIGSSFSPFIKDRCKGS